MLSSTVSLCKYSDGIESNPVLIIVGVVKGSVYHSNSEDVMKGQ